MPFTGPNYAIPAGTLNPAVVGTPISAADWNAFIIDLQAALTDTLRATTQAFVGQVEFDPTGDAGTPALSFTGDPDTGIFQKGANELGLATGGSERVLITDTLVTVTDGLAVSGNETVGGTLGVVGNADIDANLNVDGTLTVDGVSTLTGRVTLGAGVAGILPGDLPASAIAAFEISPGDSGAYSTASDVYTPVTNMTVMIVSNGRPMILALVPAAGKVGRMYDDTPGAGGGVTFKMERDNTTKVGEMYIVTEAGAAQHDFLLGPFCDIPGAPGTYTYVLSVKTGGTADTVYITNMTLIAHEV